MSLLSRIKTILLCFFLYFHEGISSCLENEEQKVDSKMFPATSMPDRDWWQALWTNPKNVLRSIDIASDMVVIDLCCGDGYFTIPLAEITTKVYGLELDEALLGGKGTNM